MGTMIAREIAASSDLRLGGGVELPGHDDVGRRLCDVWGQGSIELVVRSELSEFDESSFDVLIDASAPGQAVACAEKASDCEKGLVICTTGLNHEQMAKVERAAAECPIVIAPNLSVGVNVLFALAARATETLGADFDVEIVEAHHRRKRDAPSGTALRLGKIVAGARGLDPQAALRCGRSGIESTRKSAEIGVHSLRSGEIVGRHAVHFTSSTEEIVLKHEAFSRDAFAKGAVRAVRYVNESPPGAYDMMDVLGLRF
jgi:4-hydroxy-tetrahydrodipicolinate reductase